MQRISITTPVSTEPKKYWKTYISCAIFLAPFVLLSTITSVQSMYSNTSAQEFEFKKRELTESIRLLEQEQSKVSNLHSLHAQAVHNGYTSISNLQYVEMPSTQVVAQR